MNPPELRFSAIVLAAGTSSRMGGPNKLLLPVGGEPVIRRSVRTVLAAGMQETVVVTGHQGREVMKVLADLPVTLQTNLRYEDGQMRSVAAGVAALAQATDAIVVCLGDMALLQPQDLRELMAVYAGRAGACSIVIPRHGGERGNPIVFAASYAPEVAAGRKLIGCRKLAQQYPEETWYHEAAHDRFTCDIDLPGDYERTLARLGLLAEAPA